MAWGQEEENVQTPTSIGVITFTVEDRDGTNAGRLVEYRIAVLDQRGDSMKTLVGDLNQHISSQWRQRLLDFMDYARDKAVSEILP